MATEILTAIDRDALERALVAVCRESPEDVARRPAIAATMLGDIGFSTGSAHYNLQFCSILGLEL